MAIDTLPEPSIPVTTSFRPRLGFLTATPIIAVASIALTLIIAMAILAPLLAPHDPQLLAPAQRLKPSSAQFLLGTDAYGRDVLSRIIYGGRISLLIGLGAAVFSISIGLLIGLVSGFFKWVDAVMMRIMGGEQGRQDRHCDDQRQRDTRDRDDRRRRQEPESRPERRGDRD